MSKKNLKRISIFIIIISVFLCTSIYARDTNWTNGSSFTWSPDVISNNVIEYTGYLSVRTKFEFDQAAANENNNIGNYFTFEHNNDADGLDGYSQLSNIPNPHFDWDDDNGDGYDEESEVVEDGNILVAGTDYYLHTWWSNQSGSTHPGGTLYIVAQDSFFNILTHEYEGWDYDLLLTESYTSIPSR